MGQNVFYFLSNITKLVFGISVYSSSGVKLSRNRQTAAELSVAEIVRFYSYFHQCSNISDKTSERRRFSGLAAIRSPIKRIRQSADRDTISA